MRLIVGSPNADLARLARDADPLGGGIESLDVSCCGNVYKETLTAGKYAFILHDLDFTQPGRPTISWPSSTSYLDQAVGPM